jgi:hypothetical protein
MAAEIYLYIFKSIYIRRFMYVDMKFYHLINLTSIVRERERELK